MNNETEMPGGWYAVITRDILLSKELNDKHKLLLALISNLQGQRGYCYAGNQYIADMLNCSSSAIKESLRFLVEKGWVKREIFRNEKGEITERSLEVILKKCQAPFDQSTPPMPDNRHTPPAGSPAYPSAGIPADLYRNSGHRITKVNNEEGMVSQTNFEFPTLEQVKGFSTAAKEGKLWCDTICQAMNFKSLADRPDLGRYGELFEWMDLFDLHVSNSEEIKGLTLKRYKLIFTGWIRKKNADGVKLSDYKQTQPINNGGNNYSTGPGQSSSGGGQNAKDQPGRTITHDRP